MISARDRERLAASSTDAAAALLARMHADDAADLLAEMPGERRRAVTLSLPDRERRRILVLLGEEPATAAALMSRRFIALHDDATVADALGRVRASGLDPESAAVVFVCSDQGRLTGSLALKRLLEAAPDTGLRELEHFDTARLRLEAGFEEIARLIADRDLPAAPVVDAQDRLRGVITADDVLELMMPDRWRRRYGPQNEGT